MNSRLRTIALVFVCQLLMLAILTLAHTALAQGPVYMPLVEAGPTPTALPDIALQVPSPYGCFYGSSPILHDAAGVDWWVCQTSNGFGTQVFRRSPGGRSERAFDPHQGGSGVLAVGADGYLYLSVWSLDDDATARQLHRFRVPGWAR